MKKVIIGLVIVIALIGGGAYFVVSNLDDIVKQAIETAGTEAVGSQVRVDSVSIDLSSGSAGIFGFSVANPPGFSNASMLSFDELSVALDLSNLSGDLISIDSVTARKPHLRYETIGKTTNLDAVRARIAGSEDAPPKEDSGSSDVNLVINSIVIEDVGATLQSDILPREMEVSLGDINLQNLSGTPTEIANQVMRPVFTQLSRNAADAMIRASAELLQQNLDELGTQAKEQAEEKLDALEDRVNEQINEKVGEDVREGISNLLKRN